MRLTLSRDGWITALAVLALVLLARGAGLLQTLEFAASDARARLLLREVSSDVVIVGIDAQSLAALDRWPWPRRHHAELIRRLADAAPRRVFLDIDFSSRSNELDDAVLESAIAAWSGEPIALPAFLQSLTAADRRISETRPLERFARHARIVSVNREPAADGMQREWRSSWRMGERDLTSVIGLDAELPPATIVPIDYSIAPASFEYISYVELLDGRAPLSRLTGKTIYVGATAIELGDMVPVPVHRSLPGVVVQALALESARAGMLHRPAGWALTAALAAWTMLCAAILRARAWRRNALALAGALALIAIGSTIAWSALRLMLEAVPFAVATLGIFVAVTLRSLDQQTWRAVTYALGMRRRNALLKSVVHSSTDCILCIDEDGIVRSANPAASRLFAGPTSRLVGAPVSRFIPLLAGGQTASTPPFRMLDGSISEWDARALDGRAFPVELALGRVRLHSERLYTAIVRDISGRKEQELRLRHQATHDSLTQLPNRAALMHRLDLAMELASEPQPFAVLMLDLCRFKEVNDTLGHNVGDQVLCEAARRLQQTLGRQDLIARIGGDEFAAVVGLLDDEQQIPELCRRLHDCLSRPIDVAGISLEVGVSIGIAAYPRDAVEPLVLLKHADVAMYLAKRRGSSFEYYDAQLDDNSVRKLAVGGELRAAIATGALALHYQPQVNLRSNRVESVEALLRWRHPTLGDISPAEFIAIAESTDLIRPLTDWTIAEAIATGCQWRAHGMEVRIAANLSARMLQDVGFAARLRALLEAARADPSLLELEITESAMMLDPARALDIIRDVSRLGVLIAVDDFGSGYSSLGYLRDLPAHALKLDKSFVAGMRSGAGDRIIVESTVQMAHALRLKVVAEGVESAWDASFLARAGYDYGQGYYYSQALPAADCADWIAAYNERQPVAVARSLRGRRRLAGRR